MTIKESYSEWSDDELVEELDERDNLNFWEVEFCASLVDYVIGENGFMSEVQRNKCIEVLERLDG